LRENPKFSEGVIVADETRGFARLGRKPKEALPLRVYDNYDDDPKSSWAAKLDAFVPVADTKPAQAAPVVEEPKSSAPTLSDNLLELIDFDGALCAALVDSDSGMILGRAGAGVDMDLAAAGASVTLKARRTTIRTLGLHDEVEDLLISLTTQLHIIRPLKARPAIFLYMVVDREKSSLAMARFKATEADAKIVL
jgi:predicted regulator of Ras-like GTPase activity (Roadblock/LC7/MglB family)